MDFSALSSPEVYMSVEEIAEELQFQKVLLQSLDESVDERNDAEATVRAEIRSLEQQLRRMKDKEKQKTMASSTLYHSFNSQSAKIARDEDPFGPFLTISDSKMTSLHRPSSTSSTPDSAASAKGALADNSQLDVLSRKRTLGEHLGSNSHSQSGNKSRRTSPSPHATRSTTPSTSSGGDFPQLEDGFFDLTGDDDSVSKELEQTLKRQKQAEEKAKREREDEEYARSLQNELSGTTNFSSQGSRTAFDRMLGRYNQPSTSSSMSASQRSSNESAGNSVLDQAQLVTRSVVKPEPGYRSGLEMPGAYGDSDSDSDIEWISGNDFHDNGRQAAARPASLVGASSSQVAASSLFPFGQSHIPTPGLAYGVTSSTMANGYSANSQPDMHYLADLRRQSDLRRERMLQSVDPATGIRHYPPHSQAAYAGYNSLPQLGSASGINGYPAGLPGLNSGLFGSAGFPADPLMQMINRTSMNIPGPLMGDLANSLDYRMHDIYHDPRKTQQEIKELLENIRPDENIPKEDREGTPEGLKYPLYEHQKLALAWLKSMEEGSNKGGILADDMGLGKTISALALILSRPSTDRNRKTTLIVGPVALVRQWEREIHTKIKSGHRLSTFLYHANKKAKWDTLRNYDVVLTTYGTLGAEYGRYHENEKKKEDYPDFDDTAAQLKLPFLGRKSKFYRVILDEAQCIKNKQTKAALAVSHLCSITRLCLTGTPMMNGVHELYSLIRFLRIKPYNDYSRFTQEFSCLTRGTGSTRTNDQAMKKLQAVLKAILLRRTKQSKIDGKPILILPKKTEEIVHAVFDEDEDTYYRSLERKTRVQFNKYVRAGTIGKNYSNILVLLLRLRQAACHPHLIMDFDEAPSEATIDDMTKLAEMLLPDVVARLMAATLPFECPVCYDPVPNPRIVIPCGHDTCSECLVKIVANSADQNIAEGLDQSTSKCPTCRGAVDLKQIIDYETFKKVHMPDNSSGVRDPDATQSEDDDETIDDSTVSGSDSESDSRNDSDSDDSLEDIRNFVVPDGYESSDEGHDEEGDNDEDDDDLDKRGLFKKGVKTERPTIKKEVKNEDSDDDDLDSKGPIKKDVKTEMKLVKDEVKDEDDDDDDLDTKGPYKKNVKAANVRVKRDVQDEDEDDFVDRVLVPKKPHKKPKAMAKKLKKSGPRDKKGNGRAKDGEAEVKHTSLAMLKKEAMKNGEGRRKYMRYLRKNWISSAKVDKCLDLLRDTDPSVKTIVFSQFTTLLDLLEVPVRREKWGYERYDGSMSADARNDAVVTFTDDPRCKIMLVSLKAGNAGLNLTAASQVIIMDPFWNPYIEMQAVDRAHRIGQQKPVKVHRILIENTVEDRIIELQNQKRKLVDAALDEKASRGLGRLGQRELIYLFGADVERETAARPAYAPGLAGSFSPSMSPSPGL